MDAMEIIGLTGVLDAGTSTTAGWGGKGMKVRSQNKYIFGMFARIIIRKSLKRYVIEGDCGNPSAGNSMLGEYRDETDAMKEMDKMIAFFEANPEGIYQMG